MPGFAGAGGEIFNRGLVGLEVIAGEEPRADALVEWLEPEGGKDGPAAEGVAADLHAVAGGQDLFLTVVRQMVAVLRDDGVGDESGGGGEAVLQTIPPILRPQCFYDVAPSSFVLIAYAFR